MTLKEKARALKSLAGIDSVLYALKANWHPDIIKLFHAEGLGFECVSRGEVEHVMKTVPSIEKHKEATRALLLEASRAVDRLARGR